KDRYLARLARAHVGLVALAPVQMYCADSLAWAAQPGEAFPLRDALGSFDVVLANPPFGARIVAASAEVQGRFVLGHSFRRERGEHFVKTSELCSRVPPQILFVERCLSLVRPGGRVGIVLPESLLSGKTYRHVVQFMREHARVRAVIAMPESLFKTSGKGGTH